MENSSDEEDIFLENEDEENTVANANNSNSNTESSPEVITRTVKIKKIPVETVEPEKEVTRTLKIKKIPVQEKDDEKEEKIKKRIIRMFVKKQPTTLEEWTKARSMSRLQELFGYTEEGDLEVGKVLESDQKKIIVLPKYKEATSDYIHEKIKEKNEAIKKAEDDYTKAKRNLQNVMADYLASEKSDVDISEVLRANQEVKDMESALNTVAKYPRTMKYQFNRKLKESDLTFDSHDKRPVASEVRMVEYTYFSPEDLFMLADEEEFLNLEGSNANTYNNSNADNNNNNNSNSNSNNSSMRGGKKPLSMAAIMAIKARKAARGF
jgi:nucleoside diphosphate kinase